MTRTKVNYAIILRPVGWAWCFFSILFLSSCQNEISEIKALTDPQNLPVQTSTKANYRYSERGKLRNILEAAQLDQYQGEQEYIEASGGFTMIFFDTLEVETARLNAVHGKFVEKENRLVAWENVEMFNTQNERLETQEITFLQDSDLIYTDKFVTISTNSGIIRGIGLRSNQNFTKYRILKPTGDVYINEPTDTK